MTLPALLLALTLPLQILQCQLPSITDWEDALRYGDLIGYVDYPMPDGKVRHTRWQTYRKRLTVFIYMYPDEPGAREGNAWHGCGMYDLGEWFP